MIIFIDGPDNEGRHEFFNYLSERARAGKLKKQIYTCNNDEPVDDTPETAFMCKRAQIKMMLQVSHAYRSIAIVMNGGPLSLAADSVDIEDPKFGEMAMAVFHCQHYHNVGTVSVASPADDRTNYTIYRSISSAVMSVMSDEGNGNAYRMFINAKTDESKKMFVDDVLSLINN